MEIYIFTKIYKLDILESKINADLFIFTSSIFALNFFLFTYWPMLFTNFSSILFIHLQYSLLKASPCFSN